MANAVSRFINGPVLDKLTFVDHTMRDTSAYIERTTRDQLGGLKVEMNDRLDTVYRTLDGMDTAVESLTDALNDFSVPEVEIDLSGVESTIEDIERYTSYVYDHIDNVYSKVDDVESIINDIDAKVDTLTERVDALTNTMRLILSTVNDIESFMRQQGGVVIDVNIRRALDNAPVSDILDVSDVGRMEGAA